MEGQGLGTGGLARQLSLAHNQPQGQKDLSNTPTRQMLMNHGSLIAHPVTMSAPLAPLSHQVHQRIHVRPQALIAVLAHIVAQPPQLGHCLDALLRLRARRPVQAVAAPEGGGTTEKVQG